MVKKDGDRRSRRSRQALHDAMHALMREKRYDAITVEDIISRADVGRSTFYAHFQDKEDLTVSTFRGMLDDLGQLFTEDEAGGRRLLPTRELFQHVQEHHQLFRNLINQETLELIHEKGQEYWGEKLEAQLLAMLPEGGTPAVPLALLANHLAGTVMNTLKWWLEHKMPYSPERMDEIVHAFVMPAVRSVLGLEAGGGSGGPG